MTTGQGAKNGRIVKGEEEEEEEEEEKGYRNHQQQQISQLNFLLVVF